MDGWMDGLRDGWIDRSIDRWENDQATPFHDANALHAN